MHFVCRTTVVANVSVFHIYYIHIEPKVSGVKRLTPCLSEVCWWMKKVNLRPLVESGTLSLRQYSYISPIIRYIGPQLKRLKCTMATLAQCKLIAIILLLGNKDGT